MRLDSTNYAKGGHTEYPYLVVAKKWTNIEGGTRSLLQYSEQLTSLRVAEDLVERLTQYPDWEDPVIYSYRGYAPLVDDQKEDLELQRLLEFSRHMRAQDLD